jgi:Fatty acid synthase subunit alpha Acyl carrier domain
MKDSHSSISTFNTDTHKTVLSAYFLAVAPLRGIDASNELLLLFKLKLLMYRSRLHLQPPSPPLPLFLHPRLGTLGQYGGRSDKSHRCSSHHRCPEIASAPEKGEELPLEELGSALGSGFSGALGKYSTGLISCLIGSKIPGGFNLSAIKSYLSKNWGLGSSRSNGVLLLKTTLEPSKRLANLKPI